MEALKSFVNIMDTNISDLKESAQQAVNEISQRAGKKGQFLNWIDVLPNNQLATLDNLFAMAEAAKADGTTDLAILGIGGSRHTTESMVNMLGIEDNIHFYSALDETSFKKFSKKLFHNYPPNLKDRALGLKLNRLQEHLQSVLKR